MREQIRKPIKNEDLYDGCREAFTNGWQKVKLYFLCGLPGERPVDLDGIVEMAETIARIGKEVTGPLRRGRRQRLELRAQAAHAVPVERHAGPRVLPLGRHSTCAAGAGSRSVKIKQHDIERSLLEGILTRGDRRVAPALEEAWRRGARLDGWTRVLQARALVADLRGPGHRRRLLHPAHPAARRGAALGPRQRQEGPRVPGEGAEPLDRAARGDGRSGLLSGSRSGSVGRGGMRGEVGGGIGETTSPGAMNVGPGVVATLVALLAWTAALAAFFRDVVGLRRALFYFDITEINYPYRDFLARELRGRPVLALVPRPLLRPAAVQREPGGLPAPAEVPALPLAADLAGVEPRHGAVGLAGGAGGLRLAAPPRRAGRGADRRGGLRPGRVHLGAPGPHQHDQRPDERPVRLLGARGGVERGPAAWRGAGGAGPGVPGLRGPLAGHDPHGGGRGPVCALPRGDRAWREGSARGGGDGGRHGRPGDGAGGRAVGPLEGAARPLAPRRRAHLGRADLRLVVPRAAAHAARPRGLRHPRPRHRLDGRLLSLPGDGRLPGRHRAGPGRRRRRGLPRPLGRLLGAPGRRWAGS